MFLANVAKIGFMNQMNRYNIFPLSIPRLQSPSLPFDCSRLLFQNG